jgi:hypothetical protein
LLLFVPVAVAVEHFEPDRHLAIFVCAGLAILPWAAWTGRATERIAGRLGEGVGGLLNATFGNAAKLIIALAALREGLYDVVKASIAGSIVSNILLVVQDRADLIDGREDVALVGRGMPIARSQPEAGQRLPVDAAPAIHGPSKVTGGGTCGLNSSCQALIDGRRDWNPCADASTASNTAPRIVVARSSSRCFEWVVANINSQRPVRADRRQ